MGFTEQPPVGGLAHEGRHVALVLAAQDPDAAVLPRNPAVVRHVGLLPAAVGPLPDVASGAEHAEPVAFARAHRLGPLRSPVGEQEIRRPGPGQAQAHGRREPGGLKPGGLKTVSRPSRRRGTAAGQRSPPGRTRARRPGRPKTLQSIMRCTLPRRLPWASSGPLPEIRERPGWRGGLRRHDGRRSWTCVIRVVVPLALHADDGQRAQLDGLDEVVG